MDKIKQPLIFDEYKVYITKNSLKPSHYIGPFCESCNNKLYDIYFTGYVESPEKIVEFNDAHFRLDPRICFHCSPDGAENILCTIYNDENMKISANNLSKYEFQFLRYFITKNNGKILMPFFHDPAYYYNK